MKKWIIRIAIGVVSAAFVFGFGYVAFFSMPGDLDDFEKLIGGQLIGSKLSHRSSADAPVFRGRFMLNRTFVVKKPIAQVRKELIANLSKDLYSIRRDRVDQEHPSFMVSLWPKERGPNRTRMGAILMFAGREPNTGYRNRWPQNVDLDKYTTVVISRGQFDADPIAFAIDHFQRLYEGANKSLNPPKPPPKTTTVTIEK